MKEKDKNQLLQPKQGSAHVVGPEGTELVTELHGDSKYKLVKAEKEIHPGFEVFAQSQIIERHKPIIMVNSDPSHTESGT